MSTLGAAVDLLPVLDSVSTARRLALRLLWLWRAPHDPGDVGLLVTELVANVVDHVGGEASFTLELTLSDGWLRIGVVDGSAVRPVLHELDTTRPRGRGMQLVAGIADRWGAEDHRGGKRVWFDMAPPELGDRRGGADRLPGFAVGGSRGRAGDRPTIRRRTSMSEPSGSTGAAGEGLSDEEMARTVAEQTDSASANADAAGKDWDGDAGATPQPDERG